MPLMLAAGSPSARSLTEVGPEVIRALNGSSTWLPPARSAVIAVVDGLGAPALRRSSAYARVLSSQMRQEDVARSVFPTTTATAYTSLLTGAWPGQHGMVGYAVRIPGSGRMANQLSGFRNDDMPPETWQRCDTLFQQHSRASFVVGPSTYIGSGLTRAHLRGAEYVAEDDVHARIAVAQSLAARAPGTLALAYFAEVDQAGHRHGMASDAWYSALEDVDRAFAVRAPKGVGMVVTSDHGMLDIDPGRCEVLQRDDPRLAGVTAVGGEPRMLHLYSDNATDVARTWRSACGSTASVLTRDEAVADGLFGPDGVDAVVEPRIGDVLVIARSTWSFYDGTVSPTPGIGMIGQHGALTEEELMVPLVRFGAFAS